MESDVTSGNVWFQGCFPAARSHQHSCQEIRKPGLSWSITAEREQIWLILFKGAINVGEEQREREKGRLCALRGMKERKDNRVWESITNTDTESSRQREKLLWVQRSLLWETIRAAVLSALTVKRAGPPAVTGALVINTAEFYCLWHTAEPQGQRVRIHFLIKEHFYLLYAEC